MEAIILPLSGCTQKYVHKWIWQSKYFQLGCIINSLHYLVFCMSAQGADSQRPGGAWGRPSWGRHLHAWGHPEGEQTLHVKLQAGICFISAPAPESTPQGPESEMAVVLEQRGVTKIYCMLPERQIDWFKPSFLSSHRPVSRYIMETLKVCTTFLLIKLLLVKAKVFFWV